MAAKKKKRAKKAKAKTKTKAKKKKVKAKTKTKAKKKKVSRAKKKLDDISREQYPNELSFVLQALTLKQKRWADAYMGEAKGVATEACRIAGYSGDANALGVQGHANLRNPNIIAYMDWLAGKDNLIATRDERQRYYTATMRDELLEPKDRNKAAELLGKTNGDFIERRKVEHSGSVEHKTGPNLKALTVKERREYRDLVEKMEQTELSDGESCRLGRLVAKTGNG